MAKNSGAEVTSSSRRILARWARGLGSLQAYARASSQAFMSMMMTKTSEKTLDDPKQKVFKRPIKASGPLFRGFSKAQDEDDLGSVSDQLEQPERNTLRIVLYIILNNLLSLKPCLLCFASLSFAPLRLALIPNCFVTRSYQLLKEHIE